MDRYSHIIVALLLFSTPVKAVQYVNTTFLLPNVTAACANALTVDISGCDAAIRRMRPGLFWDLGSLQAICTPTCKSALSSYESGVIGACQGQTYDTLTTAGFIPFSTIPDILFYQFNRTCLTSNGEFCNYEAALAAGIEPDQSNLNNATSNSTTDPCSTCNLLALQFDASSPYYDGPEVIPVYSSRTSSCSAIGYALATSTFGFNVSQPTITSTPCTGRLYNIQPSDSCESISKSQGIGTSWLLTDNDLPAYCAEFPSSGTLCLQNTCQTYTVQGNDTCTAIASAQNVTYAQILAWNPIFNLDCSNIDKSFGFEICRGNPGTHYVIPTISFAAVTVVTTPAPVPTNAATGTNADCGQWYQAIPGDYCNLLLIKFGISLDDFTFLNPEINSNSPESILLTSSSIVSNYPGAPGSITNTSIGSAIIYSSLPDATFVPTAVNMTNSTLANGTRSDCEFYINGADYQFPLNTKFYSNMCQLVISLFGLSTPDELSNMNPSLGDVNSPSCAFDPNLEYCALYGGEPASAPTDVPLAYPIRPGAIANCTEYAPADIGVSCQEILDEYDLTIAQFYAWNPAVNADCSNLQLDYQYCVSIPGFTPPTTTAASTSISISASTAPTGTSTSGPVPPGPIQTGQPANCIQWYLAESGDTCSAIESTTGVSNSNFHAWNPAVSSDCTSGFFAGYAYCIGTSTDPLPLPSTTTSTLTPTPTLSQTAAPAPGPTQAGIIDTCNMYAEAMSGTGCYDFAAANGISTDQLYAWNSVLGTAGANCGTEFFAGYDYCTGVIDSGSSE
ncbi:MAG: hypothetical protein MMC33_005890 [Icmadophila ericetorum]|nr:hypothetical protein [Icmadophila ericetorum]